MASADNRQGVSIKQKLLTQSKSFSFYQAIRLLQALAKKEGKTVKLSPKLSIGFPGADIDSIIEHENDYELVSTFLGLYSTDTPMPAYYVEELLQQVDNDDTTVKSFLDIFHQRIYELLFHVWCKYRVAYQISEQRNQSLLRTIYNIAGLSLRAQSVFLQRYPEMAHYIRLFPKGHRTLANLRFLLTDYFSVPVTIESCYPASIAIHDDQRNQLGVGQHQLGKTVYIGELFHSVNSNMMIRLTDLTREQAQSFMQDGGNTKKLRDILAVYSSKPFNYFIELTLGKCVLVPCILGQQIGLGQILQLGASLDALMTAKPVRIRYLL